jgi:CTP synthase
MESQRGVTQKGGTMRLGAYPCVLRKGTLAAKLYKNVMTGSTRFTGLSGDAPQTPNPVDTANPVEQKYAAGVISERHRHRYELAYDSEARKALEAAGLEVGGTSPDGKLVEIVELPRTKHPYFVAGQFHPEFKSRPTAPHPLFLGLVAAALKRSAK